MSANAARTVMALALLGLSGASHGAQPDAARARVELCMSCHGPGGNSTIAGTPSIAGQPKLFLETQLVLFREGVRASPIMQPISKDLSDSDIGALATHFAASAAQPSAGSKADPALAKRGSELAQKLQCSTCHGADLRGREQIPRLAAQREDYLGEAMIAFRDNKRIGGDTAMSAVLYGVSDANIRALAHFLAHER